MIQAEALPSVYTFKSLPAHRFWQDECLSQFIRHAHRDDGQNFSIMAWPGAGKTRLALAAFLTARKLKLVKKCLWVVPSTTLRIDIGREDGGGNRREDCSDAVWEGKHSSPPWGVKCNVGNAAMKAMEAFQTGHWPGGDDIALWVITYGQLHAEADMFAALCGAHETMLILDEVHHVQDEGKWGQSVRIVGEECVLRIPMSGTLFTTTGSPIPFVNYDDGTNDNGQTVRVFKPSYSFGMSKALKAQPGEITPSIRPVTFIKVNGEGELILRKPGSGELYTKTIEISEDGNASEKVSYLLHRDSAMVEVMLTQGVKELNRYRNVEMDGSAGGLIVCKDGDHARAICEVLRTKFNEEPILVLHDTPGSAEAISDFRTGRNRWLVTVRMVSEGVDIRRLRVLVYLTNYMTQLFLIQVLGRIWRWDPKLNGGQDGTAIIYAHPQLMKWVAEMEEMTYEAIVKEGSGPEGDDDNENDDPPWCGPGPERHELIDATTAAEIAGGYVQGGVDYDELMRVEANEVHAALNTVNPGIGINTIISVLKARKVASGELFSLVGTSKQPTRRQTNLEALVGRAASEIRANPPADLGEENPFAYVNRKINAQMGVSQWRGEIASRAEFDKRRDLLKTMLIRLKDGSWN